MWWLASTVLLVLFGAATALRPVSAHTQHERVRLRLEALPSEARAVFGHLHQANLADLEAKLAAEDVTAQ